MKTDQKSDFLSVHIEYSKTKHLCCFVIISCIFQQKSSTIFSRTMQIFGYVYLTCICEFTNIVLMKGIRIC